MKQSSGFAVIPAEVLATGNGHAIAVYAAIAQHADRKGVAWPSLKRIAEITGWSRPTVDKAVNVLIECGAVEKKNRFENGAKLSNQYFLPYHSGKKPANVQMETSLPTMETSLPTMETSLPRVGKEVYKGTQPGFHEQEPENKNQEQEVPNGSLRVLPDDPDKPAVKGDTPAHRLVNRYYDIVGGVPTNHGRDLGNAKTLLKAGVNEDNLSEFIPWLRENWRAKSGFDLRTAVQAVNEWKSLQSAPKPQKRLVV